MSHLQAGMDLVRYANCWEDPALLVEGLAPSPGDRILSIASAGDNALALLAAGAGEVVAFDVNPTQLACLDLRLAALARLDHPELLMFSGACRASEDCTAQERAARERIWDSIRLDLPPLSRGFWEAHRDQIGTGFVHAGRFERFFGNFRRRFLPLVHSQATISRLLAPKDRAEREQFYDRRWNNLRFRLLFRVAFSKFVLGRFGRDPSFFKHVSQPVSARLAARTRHALVELPTSDNPWLSYILEGHFGRALPPWLQPASVADLRRKLDRIRTFQGELADLESQGRFQAANLSDIFEYMDPLQTIEASEQVARILVPGGTAAYWNMLAPRSLALASPHRFTARQAGEADLLHRDRAWFYSSFHLDRRLP